MDLPKTQRKATVSGNKSGGPGVSSAMIFRWSALAVCLAAAFAQPQTETKAPLKFEVASVKPSPPGPRDFAGIRPLAGGQTYVAQSVPLRLMIKLMYKITDDQIVGGPAWMADDRWDVDAKAEKPSNLDQLHEMFQNLLADRFGLKFHKEKRDLTALVMTVDKSGSKLKSSQGTDPYDIPIKGVGRGQIAGTRVPIPYFCWWIAQNMNIPVVDQTSLTGFYDFTFQLPLPPPPEAGAPPQRITPADLLPDFVAAMRDQLGLKLEHKKAPVEVFVIDSVEKPSAN